MKRDLHTPTHAHTHAHLDFRDLAVPIIKKLIKTFKDVFCRIILTQQLAPE